MYTQFFGGYLLRQGIVSTEQLMGAITKASSARIKLGTFAMHRGLMTAEEVDECVFLQSREDKRFGEIALERGYLSWEQVEDLLRSQGADYLLLGQVMVDEGIFDNKEFERLVNAYQAENEMSDLDGEFENKDKVRQLISKFFVMAEQPVSEYVVMYLNLLFNNLVRFIGSDFIPMMPEVIKEYSGNRIVCQRIEAANTYTSMADFPEDTALEFASRYAKEQFSEYDEYVEASLEDFLNLHNGLFSVNMSNEYSIECSLEPPYEETSGKVSGKSIMKIPVVYPFGQINLLVTFD